MYCAISMQRRGVTPGQIMEKIIRATIFGIRLAPILLVAYWIALFTGTHIPGATTPSLGINDKILHLVAFAGLAFLVSWALPRQIGKKIPGMLVAAVMILSYAIIDEWTQGFVPRRNPDLQDFVADATGMLLGFGAYLFLRTLLVHSMRKVNPHPPAVSLHLQGNLTSGPTRNPL